MTRKRLKNGETEKGKAEKCQGRGWSCERGTKRGYRMRLNEASIDDGVGLTLSWPFKMYPFSPSHSHTVFQEITHE